jgi:hypothetical protein
MAADALAAYKADVAAGKDALLVCDTTEMADALNERIHHERRDAHAPTVTAARGHRIGVGDLILTRRNDPTIDLRSPNGIAGHLDSVRNGNRWRVTVIDPAAVRVAAQRLDDGARTVFENEYLREHVSLGYAVTVHSAQGVTADTTHAVLGENTARACSTSRCPAAATPIPPTSTSAPSVRANTAATSPTAPTSRPRHQSRRRQPHPRHPRPNTNHRTRLRRTRPRRSTTGPRPLTSQPPNDICAPSTRYL